MYPSLREKAYATILDWLLSDRLPKGAITSEGNLCRMLDMSRTPVRAALQRLETEGYLRIVPKHGILILSSSAQRVGELLEVLLAGVLFSYEHTRRSDLESMLRFGRESLQRWKVLRSRHDADTDSEPAAKAMCEFEHGALLGVIGLGRNRELERLFEQTAGRLYWKQNMRRWTAPYRAETTACMERLLQALAGESADFQHILMDYLHILKKSWT